MKCFYNGKILLKDGIFTDKTVLTENGRIKEIAVIPYNAESYEHAEKNRFTRKLFVTRVWGGGADFMDGNAAAIRRRTRTLCTAQLRFFPLRCRQNSVKSKIP